MSMVFSVEPGIGLVPCSHFLHLLVKSRGAGLDLLAVDLSEYRHNLPTATAFETVVTDEILQKCRVEGIS